MIRAFSPGHPIGLADSKEVILAKRPLCTNSGRWRLKSTIKMRHINGNRKKFWLVKLIFMLISVFLRYPCVSI